MIYATGRNEGGPAEAVPREAPRRGTPASLRQVLAETVGKLDQIEQTGSLGPEERQRRERFRFLLRRFGGPR